MRRPPAALALLLALAACDPARDALPLEPGTRLVWEVDYLGLDQYPFSVTFVRLEPDLVMDYRLEHDTTSSYGRIVVGEEALRTAHRQANFFAPGRHDYTFRDTTSVWVSDAVFAALAAGRPTLVNLGPDGAPDDTLRAAGRDTLGARLGERTLRLPALVGRTDGGLQMWVLDDAERPVILKFDFGWTLTISEVVPPAADDG